MVVNYGKNEFRLKNIIGQFAVFITLKKVFENNWFGEKNVHMQKNKRKKERKKGDKLKKGKTLEWKSQKRCFPGFLNITHN